MADNSMDGGNFSEVNPDLGNQDAGMNENVDVGMEGPANHQGMDQTEIIEDDVPGGTVNNEFDPSNNAIGSDDTGHMPPKKGYMKWSSIEAAAKGLEEETVGTFDRASEFEMMLSDTAMMLLGVSSPEVLNFTEKYEGLLGERTSN